MHINKFTTLQFSIVIGLVLFVNQSGAQSRNWVPKSHCCIKWVEPQSVCISGLLGQAVDASRLGRLHTFPEWNDGRLIKIYSRDSVCENSDNVKANQGTDWRGEHVGKWLFTASRAAVRADDKELINKIKQTVDYLMQQQDDNGYLGTYSPAVRFTSDERRDFSLTWDIWNHAYLILGFLEVNRYWPDQDVLNTAVRMGDLLYDTFFQTGKSVAYRGNHYGLSGIVLIDAVVELYHATNDRKYLDFATVIIEQAEQRSELRVVSRLARNVDVQQIGDGKIYQLCWTLAGIAKLYKVTGNLDYLTAVEQAWESIATHHLTLGASPWGGVGGHYEVFNRKGYWSPYGFVETCNTMSWIQMNRELYQITGKARYVDMIERAAYNALLGAQYPDGEGWCYHSFENGCRHRTVFRACCSSSGALALEEIPPMIYSIRENGISVNLYTESTAQLELTGNLISISQETRFPFDGNILLTLNLEKESDFPVFIRIPSWSENAAVKINNRSLDQTTRENGFFKLVRDWTNGDQITIEFPMHVKRHDRLEHALHWGEDIYQINWAAFTRGPLVYAVDGLIDGKEREERIKLPDQDPSLYLKIESTDKDKAPVLKLEREKKEPLWFLPYYLAGGEKKGAWRLTWIQIDD
ncbi:MAG: glycoside hydrolase family 127 protein [candidate division KSB1 bacterium]|nr:glycoside hydrolase family 127 protein [candidate division KSB1 bacterium]